MAEVPFDNDFIRQVEQDLVKEAIDRMDKISYSFHAIMVDETPVEYGQARAGWNYSLNEMDETVPPKPRRARKGEKKNILPPPPLGPNQPARELTDTYHVSNFVSHIVFLNEGTSDKIGPNYIEAGLQSAIDSVDRSLL